MAMKCRETCHRISRKSWMTLKRPPQGPTKRNRKNGKTKERKHEWESDSRPVCPLYCVFFPVFYNSLASSYIFNKPVFRIKGNTIMIVMTIYLTCNKLISILGWDIKMKIWYKAPISVRKMKKNLDLLH